MTVDNRRDLTHDLFLPTLLFVALGALTWAVRGSAGFGASAGCIFAGVTLGAAWWYIARDPSGNQSRRYTSGWIILAMTVGFGIAGNCGWMQWPSFFDGRLCLDYGKGIYVPISRSYGFLWLFLAGVPWAGLGACFLAWSSARRPTAGWQWLLRIGSGFAMAYVLGYFLYYRYPEVFLPLYASLKDQYQNLQSYPSLRKLVRDNHEALTHMGFYLGFLAFEIGRRDWKNTILILTVGILNGVGWALCQNWSWAARLWPHADFNFWRSWETSGGISIGFAYGIAYFLVNRKMSEREIAACAQPKATGFPGIVWLVAYIVCALILGWMATEVMPVWSAFVFTPLAIAFAVIYYVRVQNLSEAGDTHSAVKVSTEDPNLERWGAYLGLIFGLGLSLKNGLKGWAGVYGGDEKHWNEFFWNLIGPAMIIIMIVVGLRILFRTRSRSLAGDVFPHAYGLVWFVVITQNIIAQMITGPYTEWKEVAFNIYYLLLFLITSVILVHFRFVKSVELTRVR